MSSRKPAPPMAPTRQSPGSSSNTGASNSDVSSNTATARLRNLSLEASQTTSKDPEPKQWADINENLIGGKSEYDGGKELAKRGKNNFYTKGKGVNILINCYRVQSLKTTTVYQYNVSAPFIFAMLFEARGFIIQTLLAIITTNGWVG